MQKKLDRKGFSIIELLVAVIVVAAIAACGWLAWRHTHDKKKSSGSTSTSSQQEKSSSTSDSSSTANVYAGWKSYCDTTYKYCFKYPSTWQLAIETVPQEPCDAGQIDITSPDGAVDVSYQNDNNHDGNPAAITPTSIEKMANANQPLTIVGSYFSDGTNKTPSYAVVDSSLLTSNPLAVGSSAQFPEQAEFTDKTSGTTSCAGSFASMPNQPVNTAAGAQAWFATSDAKTGLRILESFYYQ